MSSKGNKTSLMGSEKKVLLQKLPGKLDQCLRPDTVLSIVKLWCDFSSLYTRLRDWKPDISPADFLEKAKEWVNQFTSLAGQREGYEHSRITPYMHIMVAHIPWFLQMCKTVKMFTGQGVEKNNDVARSIVLRKSQHYDSVGDVLKHEARQWTHRGAERDTRRYVKCNANYWEMIIFEKRFCKRQMPALSLKRVLKFLTMQLQTWNSMQILTSEK
ncbi:Hypothetical predicted protein [Paramuricea clavata]|uniref:Uncharacterized protein n=1 Tax=Paramuricea clavata TaxID=317549 RepID=A0A6S7HYL8_PARCT|nr:Hypothetical predicted protein [Paramuricea clavata]